MRAPWWIFLLLLACDPARSRSPAPPRDAPDAAAPASSEQDASPPPFAPLAALATDGPYVDLDVAGFGPAVVSVPRGATEPRPIVLASHGNYDRPEWQCQVWRGIVNDSAFVLCPRGIARRDSPSAKDIRFTYSNRGSLEREIDAGLAALRARFGAHVADGPIVYTGFSLGAIVGVGIAAPGAGKQGGRTSPYERAVLIEGGHDGWTADRAKRYASLGGKKVLFACGQADCFVTARKAAANLEHAGIPTRTVGVKNGGHTYDGPVAKAVSESWAWLLE